MAEGGADTSLGVFAQFTDRLRERRSRAQQEGDAPAVARYDAMQAVLRTRLVPLVCPEALTLAGDAAKAACEGLREAQWLQLMGKQYDRASQSRVSLYKAVRLLRTVGIWPWRTAARAGLAAGGGVEAPLVMPAAGKRMPQDTALSLEV